MKRTLLRLAGLLIAVMLVLSGCNLIGTDQLMKISQDLAAKDKQYSAVVAEYDGGEVTQKDVMASFYSQYSYMSQMYAQYYGAGVSADLVESMKETSVQNEVQHIAIAREMEKRGLSLDAETLEHAREHADEDYQAIYDNYYAETNGSDDVRAAQTEYNLFVNGITKDALYHMEESNANYGLIQETVEAEVTEVSDEQLQEAFDEKVADDEELYTDNPSSYGSMMTSDGVTAYWVPEGYRTVKHILIIPEDDVLSAVTDARSALKTAEDDLEDLRGELDALNDDDAEADEDALPEETRSAEDIQADIDAAEAAIEPLKADVEAAEAACLASQQDKIDEIYEKLANGEDFEALIEAYGEDPGMQNEPTKTRGYYVCAESTNWDQNFTDGAMALANIGDVSETPVIGTSGIHIIRYESDVPSGAVALDDVRDALYDDTLATLKTEHFDEELAAWTEALNPVYHLDAFKLD